MSPLKKEHIALFVLLRAGLWEREPDDWSVFPLSETDWERVFLLSRRQTVTGLVYRGLHYLPCDYLPSESLLIRWVATVDRIERENRKMNGVLSGLENFFRHNSIRAVVQKGQGVSLLYERPLLRECGDIDLYFPSREEAKRAVVLVQDKEYQPEKHPDGSTSYTWQGIEVEHHPVLFDLQNPFLRGYLSFLVRKEGFREVSLSQECAGTVTVLSPLLNLLLLNAHIMKHALGLGIGLRQFCDMARACYSTSGQVDLTEMKTVYRKVGIEKWSVLLHSFLVHNLGLPTACQPYGEREFTSSEALLDIVLGGGNFGRYSAGRDKACKGQWQRKLHTLGSFCRNYRFSSTYAPAEAFWTSLNLFWGQIR